jgi:hypothetical protein
MYFTGLIFLTTVSRNIRFVTATLLTDRKKKTIMDALKQVLKIYQGKGHKVQDVEFNEEDEKGESIYSLIADNEFQSLRDDIEGMGIEVNIVSKNEHAPEIERQNRVIKERARGIVQTLPYKILPKKMRIAMIQYIVFWLNNIPKEGQSESPREMIIGHQVLDIKMVCKIPFGAYAQVHDNNDTTNTMIQRTTGGINLGPSNMNGSFKFLSLETGGIIVRRSWTELPVPNNVIMRVEEMTNDMQDDIWREFEDQELIEFEDQEIDMLNDTSNDEGAQEDKDFVEAPVGNEHIDLNVEQETIENFKNLEPENIIEEDMTEEGGSGVINEIESEEKRDSLTDEVKERNKENMGYDSKSQSTRQSYAYG